MTPGKLILAALLVLLALMVWFIGWRLQGGVGFALAVVMSSPLIGIAVSLLGMPLLSLAVRTTKQLALRDIEGRHYAYKGRPLRIFEDLAGDRWLAAEQLRRVLPGLPSDAALQRAAGEGAAQLGRRSGLYIAATTVDALLEKSQDEGTIRFRNWLQREVIFPARNAQRRAGASSAEFPPSPDAREPS